MEELKKQIEAELEKIQPIMFKEARLKRKRRAELFAERVLTYKQVLKWINDLYKKNL
jgi:hypothetical protein